MNIFKSQLVNSQKRRTISQNQSLQKKIKGLKKKTQKKPCQPFNCILDTHLKFGTLDFPDSLEFPKVNLSTAFWRHTLFKFDILDFQSFPNSESREKNKMTHEKKLRKSNVNLSTAFWRQTHLKFGPLDFPESVEFSKVNLSTPKSDAPFLKIRVCRKK